jgi:hydroxymethylpyrimidine/phosphomethylpyrimidine kinase
MLVRKALTIAGSDSGGGAGIQADLKTFASLGVYGTSAITAVTAQNTMGVTRIAALSPAMVVAQIDAVLADIGADAIKTGMLANAAIIAAVATAIREGGLRNVVVDPVMVATSGDLLLKKNAVRALREKLIPLATVVTPNVPEAQELTGLELRTAEDFTEAARRIIAMGARSVVIKGGHRTGPALDLFYDGVKIRPLQAPRIRTKSTHGTGCTFSAAIAAHLAQGAQVEPAVIAAKKYITKAIASAFPMGTGHGPVHHFHKFWRT